MTARSWSSGTLIDAAIAYAEVCRWDVAAGARLLEHDGPPRCSCGDPVCTAPGAHPVRADWALQCSNNPAAVRHWWSAQPDSCVLLPTGRSFDAVDVPFNAGCLALARLERLGVELGPVLSVANRRMVFLVLPGIAEKVPDLLRRIGWAPAGIDLVAHGDGSYVPGAPSRIGRFGYAQWARPPRGGTRWMPDVKDLLPSIAYACGQETRRPSLVPARSRG
ncbi:bifunctional DNA primase/polymerase [Allostreptomyces psammosilenae]|uniref:DNA primase/polymerase bifunctional N-terminal domain-containing protein n=1 Tax=Allostreptomyces psammosilenae TaxID=1892865 RepID=A0A852ZZD7_9ACTN|nr:bifunctional DNA primase/polymerase [Allostreptomyces psammosilenae]NYI07743.1 hypothetical protein [Allostreptomyces psammosilenae]